ncbi:CAP domain-containing protein [Paracoccus sp. Ld10]|uniref:CAP domain-containing protein n=1 Tax=Paracoccus sp. Ld10 TaxID=649158 RepID=UPI00386D37E9
MTRHLSCFAAVAMIVAGAWPAHATTSCEMPTPLASQAIASAVSQMRAKEGLGPVTVDPALTAAATQQACRMAARGRLSHQGGGGVKSRARSAGYAASVVAENIAAGQHNADAAMRSWARSPGHRSNMLHARVHHVGIGKALAADGRTVFWAMVLAAPR